MYDLLYLAITVAFFLVAGLYVSACARLQGGADNE